MADYAKKKNDELQALCKERGLAHTGKKADLVKRLEDHDAQGAGATKPTEDEIDWDDEPATETAKATTTEPAANAVAAGGVGEVPNPVAVPNQEQVEDPQEANDLTVIPPEANGVEQPVAKEPSPEKDFSTGLAERTLDEEIEKRKARARKFGMPEDSDEIKALERAKRFGNTDVLKSLNAGLPTGEGRKRGREGAHDGGIRKGGRGGRRQGSQRREKGRPSPAPGSGLQKNGSNWMSEADKAAVEKRKARFAKTD